jgi:hypothetical protein
MSEKAQKKCRTNTLCYITYFLEALTREKAVPLADSL